MPELLVLANRFDWNEMQSARRERGLHTFPCGRFDDIDDADDDDEPRTEGRRRRVRLDSGTPEGARKAEGGGCALRRRVVDVVDVVGSSKGRRRGFALISL